MRIRMTTTVSGSRDGTSTEQFKAGTEHDLAHTPRERELVAVFLREGWAEELGQGPAEAKALPGAPVVQAVGAAPRNKRR